MCQASCLMLVHPAKIGTEQLGIALLNGAQLAVVHEFPGQFPGLKSVFVEMF